MLTQDQQDIAERALALIPPCIHYFLQSYPCLRGAVDRDELESAARLACVQAAKSFDPARGLSAYFSRAIMHELLKSCDRELRNRMYSVQFTALEGNLPVVRDDETMSEVLTALAGLPAEDRRWITDHVIEGVSIRQLSLTENLSVRQVKKRMAAKLSRLRQHAGIRAPSGCECSGLTFAPKQASDSPPLGSCSRRI